MTILTLNKPPGRLFMVVLFNRDVRKIPGLTTPTTKTVKATTMLLTHPVPVENVTKDKLRSGTDTVSMELKLAEVNRSSGLWLLG